MNRPDAGEIWTESITLDPALSYLFFLRGAAAHHKVGPASYGMPYLCYDLPSQ